MKNTALPIKINPDPSFIRFQQTLLLDGKADRVPLFDWYIDRRIKEYVIDRPLISVDDEVDFWINAGYDFVQAKLDRKESHTAVKQIIPIQTVSTSRGLIRNMEQLNASDFRWTPIYNNTWKPDDYNCDYLRKLAHKLPAEMKLIVPVADIFTGCWMAMGFEDFCYALYDDEGSELISELFRRRAIAEIKSLEVFAECVGSRLGAVIYADDLGYSEGLLVSADVYRKFLWPYVREVIQMAKRMGVPVIYHSDGKLWDVLNDFAEMGVNGIQPLEPKSMNLTELKQNWGHRFCLMGSIDLDRLSRGTPAEIDEMVRLRIDQLGYNGGFMPGVSNTVPGYVNVINYKAMIEAVFKYGKH